MLVKVGTGTSKGSKHRFPCQSRSSMTNHERVIVCIWMHIATVAGFTSLLLDMTLCDSFSKQEALWERNSERKPPLRLVWWAWNSLFGRETVQSIVPCVHILTISWISIHPLFHNVPNKHGPRKKKSCIQGLNASTQNVPYWSLCHSRHILKISRKSIHPFCRNIAYRHAAAPSGETVKQSSQTWNSLPNYFFCWHWYFRIISWKSVYSFFHNITNNHKSRK